MKFHIGILRLVLFLLLTLLVASCATDPISIVADKLEQTSLDQKRLPRASLMLPGDVCAYEHKLVSRGVIIKMGEAICKYAEMVVRDSFDEVKVEARQPLKSQTADRAILLSLHVRAVSLDEPVWTFQENTATVIIEWTATEMSGKPLWVQTFQGEARGRMGTTFNIPEKQSVLLKGALLDTVKKAREGILTSSVLRKYARQP